APSSKAQGCASSATASRKRAPMASPCCSCTPRTATGRSSNWKRADAMRLTLAIAIYVVIWWTVLFAVLPIGLRTQGEDGGVGRGAPESAPPPPGLGGVVLRTTLVACAVFAAFWLAVRYQLISLEGAGPAPK